MVVTDAWIGLYSPYSNRTYLWIDGTIPNLCKWKAGQPDNWPSSDGSKESCGEMRKNSGSGGWNDAPCSILYRYVCEKSA
ncbi:collectin-12-like [Macrobrachium nipponense]|uniref:collectin-12-like n=1 Tax=Macrobrachium nipponense TaxID=159736 RepID=UPI0030C81563